MLQTLLTVVMLGLHWARDEEDDTGFLNIPLDTQCGRCLDPASVDSTLTSITDADSHCAGKLSKSLLQSACLTFISSISACNAACNVGMQRCVGINSDQCCNFYYDDECVIRCPGALVGGSSPSFDCGN